MTETQSADQLRTITRFSALSLVVGLVVGLAAALFVMTQRTVTTWIWHTIPQALGQATLPWWLIVGLPIVGAGLTWLALQLPGGGGLGPLEGAALDTGPREVGSVMLAALASLCFGAVLSPAGPLMALGTALGALAFRDPLHPARNMMMTIGALAAGGAVMGNPLVTTILLLEVVAFDGQASLGKTNVILPALAGLAGGYMVQVGLGPWSGLGEVQLALPGLTKYDQVKIPDLLVGVVLAAAVAVVSYLALRSGYLVSRLATKSGLWTLLLSGAVVGLCSWFVVFTTGQSHELVLFAGNGAMLSYLAPPTMLAAVVVFASKFIAYAFCLGGGFRGGVLFPAIALGTMMAGITVLIVGTDGMPALAAVAIAAATAGSLGKPFTALVMAVLLTASAGSAVTVPAIVGAIVGMLVNLYLNGRFSPKAATPDA